MNPASLLFVSFTDKFLIRQILTYRHGPPYTINVGLHIDRGAQKLESFCVHGILKNLLEYSFKLLRKHV